MQRHVAKTKLVVLKKLVVKNNLLASLVVQKLVAKKQRAIQADIIVTNKLRDIITEESTYLGTLFFSYHKRLGSLAFVGFMTKEL